MAVPCQLSLTMSTNLVCIVARMDEKVNVMLNIINYSKSSLIRICRMFEFNIKVIIIRL